MTTNQIKGSLVDDSREQTRKAQLMEDREVTHALQSKYDSQATRHPTAAQGFVDAIKGILSGAGLTSDNVTARVKSFRSLRRETLRHEADGSYVYPDPWHDIHDIIGVCVATYHLMEVPTVMDALGDSLTALHMIDKTMEIRISGWLGYDSQHLICKMSTAAPSELAPYADIQSEVQLRTALQHTWAKLEHDIHHKAPEGATDPRVDRAFALAASLIGLAGQRFDQVAAVLEESTSDDSARGEGEEPSTLAKIIADDIAVTEETLPGVLTTPLPDAPRSKSEYYDWAEELLERNDIRTVGQLQELPNPQRLSAVSKAMKYHFNPGHVRAIDDLLLAARGEKHIRTTASISHNPKRRLARLHVRLQQLAEAGTPIGDVPGDDRADGNRASQATRHHGHASALIRKSSSEAVTESGRYNTVWPPELWPVSSPSWWPQ